jgi:hypothetical protein
VTDVGYDLDAALAEKVAKPEFTFRFGGEVFNLPAEPDVRALAAFSGGRLDDALRMLLGNAQWETMQAVEAVLDTDALKGLLDAYGEHAGIELGE